MARPFFLDLLPFSLPKIGVVVDLVAKNSSLAAAHATPHWKPSETHRELSTVLIASAYHQRSLVSTCSAPAAAYLKADRGAHRKRKVFEKKR